MWKPADLIYHFITFWVEMIELINSELWKAKFVELQKSLERRWLEKSVVIFDCWMLLPEKFFFFLKENLYSALSHFLNLYMWTNFSTYEICFASTKKLSDNSTLGGFPAVECHKVCTNCEKLSKNVQGQPSLIYRNLM